MQTDGDYDDTWDEGLEGGTFLSMKELVRVQFLGSTPRKRQNKWGKDVWEWEVGVLDPDGNEIDQRILSTTSRRLRRALARHKPLATKRFAISRSGDGTDTEYMVIPITTDGGDTKLV